MFNDYNVILSGASRCEAARREAKDPPEGRAGVEEVSRRGVAGTADVGCANQGVEVAVLGREAQPATAATRRCAVFWLPGTDRSLRMRFDMRVRGPVFFLGALLFGVSSCVGKVDGGSGSAPDAAAGSEWPEAGAAPAATSPPAVDSGPGGALPPPVPVPSNVGASCDPRSAWGPPWGNGSTGCTVGLGCCRSADVDAGGLYGHGLVAAYTCEPPGSAWVCQGAPVGSPCDPSSASNDPYACARASSCCTLDGGPYICMEPPAGASCVL
jgi:hypothetical protein